MRLVRPALPEKLVSITCDRCHAVGRLGDDGCDSQEFLSYSDTGGYGSIADGAVKAIDLCEKCVVEVLGDWLRVEAAANWAQWTPTDAKKVENLVRTKDYSQCQNYYVKEADGEYTIKEPQR